MKIDRKQIMTIPNLLSLIRLLMIPVFVCLYLNGHETATAVVLLLSGLTDVVDGWIARTFRQVSDLGKAIDPGADKLTQAAMLLCLVSKYNKMLIPFLLLAVKEIFCGISSLLAIRRTGVVRSARWHGKVTTLLLYFMMILHVLWQDIPAVVSNTVLVACVAMMLLSCVMYGRDNIRAIRNPSA